MIGKIIQLATFCLSLPSNLLDSVWPGRYNECFLIVGVRCKALSEIAEGICARAYFFKCSGPLKRDCLVNAEFLKLRQKLDKSFPEFNDIVKVSCFHQYLFWPLILYSF